MKKISIVVLALFMLNSCASNFILKNRTNLSRLSYGMSKDEVHGVMGTETLRSFNNPYRTAMYMGKDEKPIEVFYYWTDGNKRGGIKDSELTPVVFSDGKVAGWGREFWTEFVTKYELRIINK